MRFLRILLFPFSLLYGLAVLIRNAAYDTGFFTSQKFDLPVISIGNLTVGGSGKSPMAEYLIRLLKDDQKTAVLSRGYGRKTKGFLLVQQTSSADETGDEPLQFKNKFPDITVAVCEKRRTGIERLQHDHKVIILDDAFQHRAVKPGLSILLYDYNQLRHRQWLLPSGNLREPLWEKRRADMIVVTKAPEALSDNEKERILNQIKPQERQPVFFSYLEYGELVSASGAAVRPLASLTASTGVVVLSGIANPGPLLNELGKYSRAIIHQEYPDHHPYSRKNIVKLAEAFQQLDNQDKLIITTEKDMQRLRSAEGAELLQDLPVYYLPVRAALQHAARFNLLIEKYVKRNRGNSLVH